MIELCITMEREREEVIHDLFQYSTSMDNMFQTKKKKKVIPPPTVSLSSVVCFQGKLYVLKMDVNSEANWKKI